MTNERENFFQPLTSVDYDIVGNSFRAYYDADKKLVFVIDFLVSDIKPNVLLVINPVGDRKWDDILENDYGMDLETVRPKKDNKYQKLDIEYAGLAQYDDLIQAYEADEVLNDPLRALVEFHNIAAKRAALERLNAAELTVVRSRETIDKTNEKITELQNRIKILRQKLTEAKRAIGKEPTKQSAAKILRIESLIDATNEKLKRAKKRLNNAQHRLGAADEEVDVAQSILDKLNVNLPAKPAPAEVVVTTAAPVPAEIIEDEIFEPKAEDMADEEVKPLFDTDPGIIDEEIAFKPIDFKAPVMSSEPVVPVTNVTQVVAPVSEIPVNEDVELVSPVVPFEPIAVPEVEGYENLVQPLAFTPPTDFQPDDIKVEVEEEFRPAPILDGFTPIAEDDGLYKQTYESKPVQDVLEPAVVPEYKSDDIEVAPVDSGLRPVSPITNETPAVDVAPVAGTVERTKPTMLYYVLLGVLIVLSIFTLWMYQNSANDAMPEIGAKTEPVVIEEVVAETVVEPESVAELIEVEPVSVEPVVIPTIEPTVVDVTEPTVASNVIAESVFVTEPVVEPEPVVEVVPEPEPEPESPFIELDALGSVIGPIATAPTEEKPVIPSEEEILASKPAYGTSSKSDEMFVAAPEYETETVVTKPVVEEIAPVVEMSEPEMVTEYVEEVIAEETCSDGNPPDMYGCCAGEDFVLLPDGEQACCAESTGECFPPM